MQGDTIEKTLNVLERDFRSLALSTDLSKLARIADVDVDGKIMYSSALKPKTIPTEVAVAEFMFTLIRWADGEDLMNQAIEKYDAFFDQRDPEDPGTSICA
jgi:hypothetical protein